MIPDVSAIATVVGVVVVLVAGVASASAIFKSNRAQATIKVLQDLSDALERQNRDLQTQNGTQQTQLDVQKGLIDKQNDKIKDLTDMVQSRAAVEALSVKFEDGVSLILSRLDHHLGDPK